MSSLLVNLSALLEKPTGISVYSKNIASYLLELEPIFFAANEVDNFKCQPIPQGLSPQFGVRGHLKRLWWLQSKMPHYYRKLQSNLIFSPLPEAPLYSDCRFIVTVHDLIPLRFPAQFSAHLVGYFRYYVRQVAVQAEHIFCDSVATANDLTEFYGISASKITPILLAYDKGHFKPCQQEQKSYFLYIGRQDPHKNLPRLIEAFQRVYQANKGLELWLVGPKDKRYTPMLLEQAEAAGVGNNVRFLDYVAYNDLPKLLGGAIALVFPSLWEGFGLPPLEAMACGTPVITSNLASLPEVVGDAAILIDPYNVDELADAMHLLAQDVPLQTQLRAAGLARAKQFSWEKTGQQTAEVLKRFL
ncbi:glycosyltransferase family 4 protein [Leptothoe sp. PORK10 BA2]|uniref:glycosyltransferase family 4 protein n=1 Tax=Leptothoe sp. PORK10 BA2 TaxID=3110254 RepID=UPI002B1FEB44|nr:glycosyltransferase family 1 protein [Leptothoe sp. PORK10 BA2]MEA5462709.1 glycosyltransferase family 1 protein [Leptothoe sp. PORK10 BA2]